MKNKKKKEIKKVKENYIYKYRVSYSKQWCDFDNVKNAGERIVKLGELGFIDVRLRRKKIKVENKSE